MFKVLNVKLNRWYVKHPRLVRNTLRVVVGILAILWLTGMFLEIFFPAVLPIWTF
jgi:hypothetical protein